MARRYFYIAAPDLVETIEALVSPALVVEYGGVVAAVVPDALIVSYDTNQPAAAFKIEDVPEGSDHGITHSIPAHLLATLEADLALNNTGKIAASAGAIVNEAKSRAVIIGGTEVP